MKLTWYKWEPGSVPYLDRISDEARGILWRWMDDYWRGFPAPSGATCPEAESVWPFLRDNLDAFRLDAESKAEARGKRSAHAAAVRWECRTHASGINEHADGMPQMPDTDTDSEEETEKKKNPPTPRKRGEPKGGISEESMLENLSLLDAVWLAYPRRPNSTKGNKAIALPRIRAVMKTYRLDTKQLLEIVSIYSQHPNVQGGYVQAVEVFFGDNGRFLECYSIWRKEHANQ